MIPHHHSRAPRVWDQNLHPVPESLPHLPFLGIGESHKRCELTFGWRVSLCIGRRTFITYALRHYHRHRQTDRETQCSFLLAKLAASNNVAPGINDIVATDLFRSICLSVCSVGWFRLVSVCLFDARLCVRGRCCCCCHCDGIHGLWPAQSLVSKFLLELCWSLGFGTGRVHWI